MTMIVGRKEGWVGNIEDGDGDHDHSGKGRWVGGLACN